MTTIYGSEVQMPGHPRENRRVAKLEPMMAMGMMGCLIAGCFGHDPDNIQWAATLGGSWIGGLLADQRASLTRARKNPHV